MKPFNGDSVEHGFEAVGSLLKSLDRDTVGRLVSLDADIVLLVDKSHKITKVFLSDKDYNGYDLRKAEGKRLEDLVTIESVPKIEAMLAQGVDRPSRGTQVNHLVEGKPDLPVVYTAYTATGLDYTLVVGRELRQQMMDQQRLVEAQMELEADFRELQEAEARYRTAFRISSTALMMVDGERKTVLDANSAALSLLGGDATSMTGKYFRDLFAKSERDRLSDAVGEARHSIEPVDVEDVGTASGDIVSLSLRSYRENGVTNLVVSIRPGEQTAETGRLHDRKQNDRMIDLADIPEAAIVTSADGQVIAANTLFLDLVHAPSLSQVIGRSLNIWFSKASLDINVLYSRLNEEQAVRGFSSILTDNLAWDNPVVMSGRRNPDNGNVHLVFVVQPNATERLTIPAPGLPEQAEGFANLVGKVPLKELIRESLDVIEKICIEAALNQTNNNRAYAAEILGLSRQSLYIKLRRYGLEDYRPPN